MKTSLPCAIYTRKSSDEGLEQDFNSLHAQREACEAYIKSQQHEGWKVVPTHYDDGGYSGGSMDRPALNRLLDDLNHKRIKIVIVYKVDRLTRSLADFAKIVEKFDALEVSFVSVTQQFNTTSSMGRLTLNVLLSFAQFEREVTGERIRDKIAASKQKGMWMGGIPPTGYRPDGRTLVVEPQGADLIREIFRRYLVLGSVRELRHSLIRDELRSPPMTAATGRQIGNKFYIRSQLYRILSNPTYIGRIPHKDKSYEGNHPAIIDLATWDAVQALLASNLKNHIRRRSMPSDSLLTGLLYDDKGVRLIASHSQKRSKRYRYYLSEGLVTGTRKDSPQGIRLPARDLETIVIEHLRQWLLTPEKLITELDQLPPQDVQRLVGHALQAAETLNSETDTRFALVQRLLARVVVRQDSLHLHVRPLGLLHDQKKAITKDELVVILDLETRVQRCGFAMKLFIRGDSTKIRQEPNAKLLNIIQQGLQWMEELASGNAASVGELSKKYKVTNSHITRQIYRAMLAPEIIRSVLNGTHPISFTSETLKNKVPLPLNWQEQKFQLGFE